MRTKEAHNHELNSAELLAHPLKRKTLLECVYEHVMRKEGTKMRWLETELILFGVEAVLIVYTFLYAGN